MQPTMASDGIVASVMLYITLLHPSRETMTSEVMNPRNMLSKVAKP